MILGTGKPVSHEVCLATWRFAYDTKQNSSDRPRSERRREINARPESGGYPKGDAVVVDTEIRFLDMILSLILISTKR